MRINEAKEIMTKEFSVKYKNFKEFQNDGKYQDLWRLCMSTMESTEYMNIILFCNNVYQLPPVKVFLDLRREEIENLLNNTNYFEDGEMKTFVKQSIGAFWGMVFRFLLLYPERKSVSVVKDKYWGVQTASRFFFVEDEKENRKLCRGIMLEE